MSLDNLVAKNYICLVEFSDIHLLKTRSCFLLDINVIICCFNWVRRYTALVEMCQIVGYRDRLITLLFLLAENVLNIILVHFQDRYAIYFFWQFLYTRLKLSLFGLLLIFWQFLYIWFQSRYENNYIWYRARL